MKRFQIQKFLGEKLSEQNSLQYKQLLYFVMVIKKVFMVINYWSTYESMTLPYNLYSQIILLQIPLVSPSNAQCIYNVQFVWFFTFITASCTAHHTSLAFTS